MDFNIQHFQFSIRFCFKKIGYEVKSGLVSLWASADVVLAFSELRFQFPFGFDTKKVQRN